MISVVICSKNPDLLSRIEKNINATIGIAHEVIGIDNQVLPRGICEVYNEGGSKAGFPLICFVHEDVSFETLNWGQRIVDHFSDPEVGLIGIAGGDTKSMVPGSWSVSLISNEINIFQHYRRNTVQPERILVSREKCNADKTAVVALDGVFMCTRKTVLDEFKFDANTLKGFHGYDIDFSLQVGQRYKLFVVFDILLHHYSEGTPDRKWLESTRFIADKWRDMLPVTILPASSDQLRQHHWRALQVHLKKLKQLEYGFLSIFSDYLKYSFTRYFSVRSFLSTGLFLVNDLYRQHKKGQEA